MFWVHWTLPILMRLCEWLHDCFCVLLDEPAWLKFASSNDTLYLKTVQAFFIVLLSLVKHLDKIQLISNITYFLEYHHYICYNFLYLHFV